jgi:hypothetical protein
MHSEMRHRGLDLVNSCGFDACIQKNNFTFGSFESTFQRAALSKCLGFSTLWPTKRQWLHLGEPQRVDAVVVAKACLSCSLLWML